MRLNAEHSWARLRAASHGVLSTVHPVRGVDAVPVVFAVVGQSTLVIPIDTVKAKRTIRLQRIANVRADPRCVVLVDHYDEDWSRLWWVRAHGTASVEAPAAEHVDALAARYPAYRRPGAIDTTIVVAVDAVGGWAEV